MNLSATAEILLAQVTQPGFYGSLTLQVKNGNIFLGRIEQTYIFPSEDRNNRSDEVERNVNRGAHQRNQP